MAKPLRVVIVRDPGPPPLHVIRCAEPCEHTPKGREWCQALPQHPTGICWLGGCLDADRARALAERVGYEVVG